MLSVDPPDGRRRLGRPLKILLDGVETGLLRPNNISKYTVKQNTVMYLHQRATFFGWLERSSGNFIRRL